MMVSLPVSKKCNSSGQALVEVLVASGAMVIVILGIVLALQYSMAIVIAARNKTLAVNYAKEGLEIARIARNTSYSSLNSSLSLPAVPAPFTRTITVDDDPNDPSNPNKRMVTVMVRWVDGTQNRDTTLRTILTNWREP